MGLATQMKNLSEDLITSFKNRIKENEELVIEVQKTLNGFHKDHQDMAAALRSSLDKGEQDRLMEADILMTKISKERQDMSVALQDKAVALRADLDKGEQNRLKEFDMLIKTIKEKISAIFTCTDNLLKKSEVERLKEFANLMKSINEEISAIFTYTNDLLEKSEVERLKKFTILMKNINEEVLRIFNYTHNMLLNGDTERLHEFDVVMKGIRNDVGNLKKAVAELLGDFAQDREEASEAWKKMQDIHAKLRRTAIMPTEQAVAVKIAEKKEVKIETPVEAMKASPAEAASKIEPQPEMILSLEERVINYINMHSKGVRISEMEVPLGETRMKLGFIAKAMLDEGKVKKVDNLYFPIKKINF